VTIELRLWLIAAICLCGFFALGYAVVHAPSLWRIDVEAAALRGEATPLALAFTLTGRALPLLAIAVISIAVTMLAHANVRMAVAIFAAQLVSQGLVEVLKGLFGRARPDDWLVHRELGFSYPSGHATTAIVFFGSWLVFVLLSPMPKAVKIGCAAIVAVWMAGIDWSRMALGAHYPTDVLGGTLFGVAFACALWALAFHFRLAAPLVGTA
jgi:undecaprenyl-diphosphatase